MLRSTADPPPPPLQSVHLLDQVRERVRYLHDRLCTEQAHAHWVGTFVRFHGLRDPRDMGRGEVEAFLSWLAVERCVAVSAHRQALSALLSADEVARVLMLLQGEQRLLAQRLHATGLRSPLDLRPAVPAAPVAPAVPPARALRFREPAPCRALPRRSPVTPSFTAAATSAS